jgi:predicted RNA methylase
MASNSTNNILKRIYPQPDYNYEQLNYDTEGLWSITHPNEADIISLTIAKLTNDSVRILDMTAGCGGNTISFCKYFNDIIAIEYDKNRFNILKNNLYCYDFNNYTLVCGNSVDYIDGSIDVYFIDPPWGGPNYKENPNIELYLSNIKLNDLIKIIPENKLIVLKLPFNYNVDSFNKYKIIKRLDMKNIIILFLINSV